MLTLMVHSCDHIQNVQGRLCKFVVTVGSEEAHITIQHLLLLSNPYLHCVYIDHQDTCQLASAVVLLLRKKNLSPHSSGEMGFCTLPAKTKM